MGQNYSHKSSFWLTLLEALVLLQPSGDAEQSGRITKHSAGNVAHSLALPRHANTKWHRNGNLTGLGSRNTTTIKAN
jgi:hypothetical protein